MLFICKLFILNLFKIHFKFVNFKFIYFKFIYFKFIYFKFIYFKIITLRYFLNFATVIIWRKNSVYFFLFPNPFAKRVIHSSKNLTKLVNIDYYLFPETSSGFHNFPCAHISANFSYLRYIIDKKQRI